MLSIIIPTLNEEKYLSGLLKSLRSQDFKDYEIIVADAGSKDKSSEIAQKFGAKVIKGGLPAKARNRGAKIAKGELFLFLDADTMFVPGTLGSFLQEFEKRKLDIATCWLQPFGKNKILGLGYDLFYNFPIFLLAQWLCAASGFILIKKELHQKVSGFDESIKLFEDTLYCQKAAKFGKFGVLKSNKLYFSQRRYQENGWLKTFLKIILALAYTIFFGPIKSDVFKYRFGHKN